MAPFFFAFSSGIVHLRTVKNLVIILLLLTNFCLSTAMAEPVKVFDCQSLFSPFQMDFQQGSEVYMDVFYDTETGKVSIVDYPAVGPKVTILPFAYSIVSRNHIDIDQGSIYFHWEEQKKTSYVSMVYLGGTDWGYALEGDLTKKNEELLCKETPHFERLFVK